MSGRFDPYHKWLGIPPREQPANYYRLLGLEVFEDDLDAIEGAADRLIKYVQKVATVEQREDAKRVFLDLSAAKRCLLVAEQKQAYDAGLRAGRTATLPTPRSRLARSNTRTASIELTPVTEKAQATTARRVHPKPTARPAMVFVSTISVLGVAVVGFSLLLVDHTPTTRVAETFEVPETPKVLEEGKLNSSISKAPTTALTENETPEATIEDTAVRPSAITKESTLPDFVAPEKELGPASDIEERSHSVAEQSPPENSNELDPESSTEPEPASTTANRDVPDRTTELRGGLLREVWTNVTGNKVEDILQHIAEHPDPNQVETIHRFEPPEDVDDQYGQRLRGYLHPPTTGSYEFSIRANAEGWLFVSTDALPENKQRIEPKAKIEFEAGKAYYVEAYHKESTGRDYLTVGWMLPDGTEENPIPGERMSVHYRIAPKHETEFVALTPIAFESSSEVKLELLDNNVILASGTSSGVDTYRLKSAPEMETITAIRLEAIPHASLPASGPGSGVGGRFALTEVSVTVIDRNATDTSRTLHFASAIDGAGHDLRRLIDGDEKTLWRGAGRGSGTVATLVVRDPKPFVAGSLLQIEITQRENLGCFRVLATSAPNPNAVLPSSRRASEGEGLYSLFVNLGGDEFTTPDGVRWRPSKLFDNESFGHEGGRGVTEDLIANKVQGSAQRGIAAFRAMVPEGTYDVNLYFCEYWSTTPSSRQFAIAVEQRVVAPRFDLFQAAGGFAKPLVYPIRNVTVTDGRLDIQFRAASDSASAILNAVSIQQVR